MQVLKTIAGLQCALSRCRYLESPPVQQVGLVPTMGALHGGHLSLIERARQDNDVVVVSIFINPLQFGPQEDYGHYPRTTAEDLRRCERAAVDLVFMPPVEVLYGEAVDSTTTLVVPPPSMTQVLCGRFRPGHFEGVATIVTKLMNIVQPDRAYFGQKDAQQLAILRQMAEDLNLPGRLIGCPTVRETDGLALSSRNQYLNPEQRQQATVLYRALQASQQLFRQGERQGAALMAAAQAVFDTASQVTPQYVELVHPQTLEPLERVDEQGLLAVAAHVGQTRLIDNLLLRSRQPIIAIDGPAGAGKSTVARQVARRLELLYLDSGAMYRAVTWLVLERGIDPEDEVAIAELVEHCDIRLMPSGDDPAFAAYPSRIWIDDREVTQAIRSETVTRQVSAVAAQPWVRQCLLAQQQQYGSEGGVVMEGRDIGTHVFPDAELKIFLTASVAERARRRQRDLQAQNRPLVSLEDLEQAIDERDRKDSTRRIAPLRRAADAIELNTDGLTIDGVVDEIVALFHQHVEVAG